MASGCRIEDRRIEWDGREGANYHIQGNEQRRPLCKSILMSSCMERATRMIHRMVFKDIRYPYTITAIQIAVALAFCDEGILKGSESFHGKSLDNFLSGVYWSGEEGSRGGLLDQLHLRVLIDAILGICHSDKSRCRYKTSGLFPTGAEVVAVLGGTRD